MKRRPLPTPEIPGTPAAEMPYLPPGPLLETLGGCRILLADATAGRVIAEFEARPAFCHTQGTIVQGGFVTAWLDFSMAYAVILSTHGRHNAASLEIKVSFLQRVGPGKVTVEGKVVRLGRRVGFLEGALWNAQGEMAATATSTVLVVPNANPNANAGPHAGAPSAAGA